MPTVEELEKQKAENSAAWHTATSQGEKDRLHQENVRLSKEIDGMTGDVSTFDSGTGQWRTSAPSDAYKRALAAQTESALAGLRDSYEQGIAAYDAQAAKVPERYQEARNRAAAQNAIARKNFNEQGAASGLNTGTTGQAALSRSASYQAALAGLDKAQESDLSELDRAKLALEAQYRNAVARARADGEAASAKLDYEDGLRRQELAREREREDYDRQWKERTYRDSMLGQSADALAQSGDFSGYGAAYGWTPEQMQSASERYKESISEARRSEAQTRINNYFAMGGSAAGLDPALVAASGYTQTELAAQERYYAQQAAATTASAKPSRGPVEPKTDDSGEAVTEPTPDGLPRGEYIGVYNRVNDLIRNGSAETALAFLQNNIDRLSEQQAAELEAVFNRYTYGWGR